jgi:hypothetical protein
MAWIIASSPFWIVGGLTLGAGIRGLAREFRDGRTDVYSLPAFLILMAIAAGALSIAASMVS